MRSYVFEQFEGLGLMPLIILVKIAGIGEWIEALLPQKEYNAAAIAAKRRKEAEELGISFGVRRDGIDDTGSNVIQNRQFVALYSLLAELAKEGYRVTDASWFWRKNQRGRKRFLQLVFNKTGEEIKLPEQVRRLFATGTAQFVNVWANVRETEEGDLYRLDTINVPVPRNMPADEELHISFYPGRYTYLVTVPR